MDELLDWSFGQLRPYRLLPRDHFLSESRPIRLKISFNVIAPYAAVPLFHFFSSLVKLSMAGLVSVVDESAKVAEI